MNHRKKITLLIILLIVASFVTGAAYDLIMKAVEKREFRREYTDLVEAAADKYGVPEYVIYAVIKTESDFDPSAKSSAGACGLMQLTAGAYTDMTGRPATDAAMTDPANNIDAGTHYLSYLYAMFGDWQLVYAAYNGGLGNVSKWLADERYSPDGKTLADIPFKETKNYVRLVSDAANTYKNLYYKH